MSDLPVSAAPGQPYGERASQERAQRAVPMGGPPRAELPPRLDAPSGRSSEPVQAGLPSGPGPGREVLGGMDSQRLTRETLQALYRRFPSDTIRRMLLELG